MSGRQAYCLRCKKKCALKGKPTLHKMKNGCCRFSGQCHHCGCNVSGIVSKKDISGGNILFDIADSVPLALPFLGFLSSMTK